MSAGYVVLALLAALVGVAAGLGTLLGPATITDRPPLSCWPGSSPSARFTSSRCCSQRARSTPPGGVFV